MPASQLATLSGTESAVVSIPAVSPRVPHTLSPTQQSPWSGVGTEKNLIFTDSPAAPRNDTEALP